MGSGLVPRRFAPLFIEYSSRQAGLLTLESELCEDYLTKSSKLSPVRKMWVAMEELARRQLHQQSGVQLGAKSPSLFPLLMS